MSMPAAMPPLSAEDAPLQFLALPLPPTPDAEPVAPGELPAPTPELAAGTAAGTASDAAPEPPADEPLDPAALEALIGELLAGLDSVPAGEAEPMPPAEDPADLIAEFDAMERESAAWLRELPQETGRGGGADEADAGSRGGGDWAL